jgi:hypothetical protein
MPGRGKGCMLPISITHFVFYKYPGGIPVKGSGGSSPRILPIEVKLHEYRLCACISTSEGDIGYTDIISKERRCNTQQITEQEGSNGGIG